MNETAHRTTRAVVIGASSGGLSALTVILSRLPAKFPFPVVIVIHRGPEANDYLERSLNEKCSCRVKQADDKEPAEEGTVYFAPPNYHLLIEDDGFLTLSSEPPVNYTRPSVDVLFESAAEVFGNGLVGIVLTGANNDGSLGLKRIGALGGLTVAQDPASAEAPAMPRSAIRIAKPNLVMPIEQIADFLASLGKTSRQETP